MGCNFKVDSLQLAGADFSFSIGSIDLVKASWEGAWAANGAEWALRIAATEYNRTSMQTQGRECKIENCRSCWPHRYWGTLAG